MSREKRRSVGDPAVPAGQRRLGSVRLDCREAICLSPVVDIEISAGAGGIKLIVPDGWGVDSDLVAKGWGSVRNTAERRPEPGQPQLVLHGSAGMGRLRVRTEPGAAGASCGDGSCARAAAHQRPGPVAGWVEEHSEMPNADDLR